MRKITNILIFAFILSAINPYIVTSQENTPPQETPAATEDNEEWFLDQPISAFEFKGLDAVSRLDLNNVLSEYKNKPFSYDILNEMQSVLYELEFFDEIIPEAQRGFGDQLILVLTVVERPTIAKISFLGNNAVGSSALQGILTIRRGDIFNSFKADEQIELIQNKYFEQGFPQIEVRYRTLEAKNSTKNELNIEFIIDEGARITISSITFKGNELFRDNKLKRTIVSKKKSIINKGTFSEELLEQDKTLITNEYHKKGYINARIVDIIVERNPDPNIENGTTIDLTYIISEGDLFTFSSISFEGNEIYSSENLRKLFPLKEGEIMNLTKFQRGFDKMRLQYADQGFIFNTFDYEDIYDDELKTVSFVIKIQELGQSHIENIILAGNIKTKDYVILRSLGIQEGEVFSASRLNYARLNLMGLQYFTSVIPDSKPGSAPGLIDLIFNVEEALTRDIRFGATFGASTEFPISLFLQWTQNNLGGRGLVLSTKATVSPFEQSVSASFTEPVFLNSPFSLSASLSFSHEKISNVPQDILSPSFNAGNESINFDPYTGHYVFTEHKSYNGKSYSPGDPFPGTPSSNEVSSLKLQRDYVYYGSNLTSVYNNSLMEYDNYRLSFLIGSGYTYRSPLGNLGARLNIGPILNFVTYDKTIFRPADIQVRNNLDTAKLYNLMSIRGFYDSRDLQHIPTKGIYTSQKLDMYGGLLFGDAHYIKSTTLLEGHIPLLDWKVAENWAWKIVLAGQTVFTSIFPTYFYPPGTSYELNGPTYSQRLDLNGLYNARGWIRERNGEATWNSWIELRQALYEPVIWWDQFFEVARLWNDLDTVGKADDATAYKFAFGTGFRFVLQQFPIRIYITKRFKIDGDGNVQWQTGRLAGDDASGGEGVDLVFTIGIDYF